MKQIVILFAMAIVLNGATHIAASNNTCPQGLPEDPEEDVLLPHEYDCTKFYKCSHGEKVLQDCPQGLYFNSETSECDWPHNVNCEMPTIGSECPEDPTVEILIPHESDCSQFYQCTHGEKVLHNCSIGLHFNPKIQKCDWPENVDCENGGYKENSTEESNNPTNESECPEDPTVEILIPHESDCSQFYQCSHGEKILHNCSIGLHFNPKIQQCDWPENVDCENDGNKGNSTEEVNNPEDNDNDNENNEQPNKEVPENGCPLEDPSEDILYPHETNCDQFYKCSHGEKVLQDCPEGLHFNPKTNECDWPENVNCSMGVRYLPHENECSKFYQLINGVNYEYNCPCGLHFNPVLQICDYESQVRCLNKQAKEWAKSEESEEDNSSE